MEFCTKCGGVLVPQKVGRSHKLVCQHCGRKVTPKKKTAYKISEKGKGKGEVAVVVEKKKKKQKPVEREFEPEPPEYYEEFSEE
jgi:DNA-directed RNA polymerase subunit M/transcription elongation factor TFIIS